MIVFRFPHIANRQIREGYTHITIRNHQAEIADDDPDGVYVALKHGGQCDFTVFRNVGTDDKPVYTSRFNLPDLGFGAQAAALRFLLDVDILTDMVEDCFRFGIAPRGFVWCERGDGNTFLLSCARWGDLGYIKLSRRGDETLMIISSIPQPTGAELSDAKMGWFRQHFHYGKQKHRAEVIRWLFDGLDRDPIWQQHSATIDAPPKLGRSTNEGPLSLPPKPDPPGRPRFEADEWARTQYHENSETLDDIIQPWLEKVKDEIPDRRFQNPRKSLRGILKRTPKSIDGKTVKQ